MYSKERGFSRPPTGGGAAYRPSRTPRVSVPPNYSGHAIVDGEERPLGMLREDTSSVEDRADLPTPRFDGLPRISELGGESRRAPRTLSGTFAAADTPNPPAGEHDGGHSDDPPGGSATVEMPVASALPTSESSGRPSAHFVSFRGRGLASRSCFFWGSFCFCFGKTVIAGSGAIWTRR
jgi:hypothetical protein